MALVVHPHFHHHRTGVTSHTEAIVAGLAAPSEARWMGQRLDARLPRIGWGELWRRSAREPVVWHAHRNLELLVGLGLRWVHPSLRVVFTRHGSGVPSAYTRWLARKADALVALNRHDVEWGGRTSAVVPHGVALERFRPPAGSRAEAWAKLGVGGALGVGVVGRLRPAKGQEDFVEAIAPLLPRYPAWRAALVGRAAPRHRAWAQGLRRRAGGALAMPGEQRDILAWYQGFTLLVNPSHRESFGLTLVEGMAAGCCVVASRLPHVSALIEHGRTGFLFEPGDAAGLRDLLERLMAQPTLAEEVGRCAAEEARARFGIEHEAQALSAVYARVLAG